MSNLIYTKAEVDVLVAAAQASIDKGPAEIAEVSGSYPLRSSATSNAARKANWSGPDFPPTTTGYALNGDRYYVTP